jgi:hypothetical protein
MRGQIEFAARAKQINDFSGLRYGNITPTDIDGVIEYKNKAYVWIETKYLEKSLPHGQRLCIARLVDDADKAGKEAIAIIVEHAVHNPAMSIPVAECYVREMYWGREKKWRKLSQGHSTRQIIDKFLGMVEKENHFKAACAR